MASSSYPSLASRIETFGSASGFIPLLISRWWFLITLFVAPLMSFTQSSFCFGSYASPPSLEPTFSFVYAATTAS